MPVADVLYCLRLNVLVGFILTIVHLEVVISARADLTRPIKTDIIDISNPQEGAQRHRQKRSCYRLPDGMKDPCDKNDCAYRTWCVPTTDGKSYRCICRQKCYDVGDSTDKIEICGDDGKDYNSLCELRIASCKNMIVINIKHYGKCDPCQGFKCPFGRVCKLDKMRTPYCDCEAKCKLEYRPVCSNDGRTFDNHCLMKKTACKEGVDLNVIFTQSCDSASERNPCLNHECSHPHQICKVDRDFRPICLCIDSCNTVYKPVCGSDGITYDNECFLMRNTCISKQNVKLLYQGPCKNANLCLKKHPPCTINQICRLSDSQTPECVCPTCPEKSKAVGDRVCGSDGKTYLHSCELKSIACRTGKALTEISPKPCDICKNKVCKYYSRCHLDDHGRAECICPNYCQIYYDPVCGSDGNTYENECVLKVESCKNSVTIQVVAQGPCKPCGDCPLGQTCLNGKCICRKSCPSSKMEVCGTDGVWYDNECELKRKSCLDKSNIEIDIYKRACRGRRNYMRKSLCKCSELGAVSPICDPQTHQCRCKPGVVGIRCDRCNANHWGMRSGLGCRRCACDRRGSSRKDCDQMTGQCICKTNVFGLKCNQCPKMQTLTDHGCKNTSVVECQRKNCAHGATCRYNYALRIAECVCDIQFRCKENDKPVCGRNRKTYPSECALKQQNCELQQTVLTDYFGKCKEEPQELNLNKEGYRLLSADEKAITKDAGVKFGRDSFMKYPSISHFGRHIGINITLAPATKDGLIFYNGPIDRRAGDFIALTMEQGYAVYRFNLGSGTLELRNRKQLSMEESHSIYIERRGRRGQLKVDDEKPIYGKSPGKRRSLNSKTPLILGNLGIAHRIRPGFQSTAGFKGCLLSAMIINKRTNKEFSLLKDSQPLEQAGTDDACVPMRPDPCLDRPCKNGGQCSTNFKGEFTCKCRKGTFGRRCEKDISAATDQVRTAKFNGKTLMKIPTVNYGLRKRIELEIWFLSSQMNGLLALLSDDDGEHFLSVMLMNGRVQLVCRTGNGIVMVRSADPVTLDEWHKVVVKKGRKFVSLIVNDNRRSRARIVPDFFKSLNKEDRRRIVHFNVRGRPLFLGGYPNNILSAASMGSEVWLTGAIQRVLINQKQVGLFTEAGVQRFNVSEWRGPPCGPSHSVCGRGTVCEPRLNSAHCRCVQPPCEQAMHDNPDTGNIKAINFDGTTLLKMKNRINSKVKSMTSNNIRLVVKTSAKNGLILLMSKRRFQSAKDDFLVLALRNGEPEFSVNVGRTGGLIRIKGPRIINDNKWHTIHILRSRNMATLLVDGYTKTGYLRTYQDTLNVDGTLWIGGYNRRVIGFPSAYHMPFVGCVEKLFLNEDPVDFSKDVRVKRGRLASCSIPFEF